MGIFAPDQTTRTLTSVRVSTRYFTIIFELHTYSEAQTEFDPHSAPTKDAKPLTLTTQFFSYTKPLPVVPNPLPRMVLLGLKMLLEHFLKKFQRLSPNQEPGHLIWRTVHR